jgi:maltose alpha-D-glucosyltransferase/alpha-amylase
MSQASPTSDGSSRHPGPDTRYPWFKDAVFYELPVKAFFDSNDDGIGDFRGLTEKLDYLAELGVTCVWLLPFYPSPLKDDGYDVADYRGIHPDYGTADDFRAFVAEAHRRGIRVAAEMVLNHTSDQHPWFQAARVAPPGSPLRDFYVWSQDDRGYAAAQVLYPDAGRSNWSWDPEARAFYFHRFFAHQPDLNFASPRVRTELRKVLRFWLDLGVDGLCLNGAAYLIEREGTRCEHLPETIDVLRDLRRELEVAYPGRMLQAGVNAWPADARLYFGNGDVCQTVPHLPLAQRLFLALRQEDRHPVTDILRQTPEIPDGCQWVLLLRNHDEMALTLSTDEERDYMYREYAADPRMRLHAGILRRLAPLADNSRRRVELLFGLLLSLPGAPKLYYGDEIGMGDNVFLGGRNAVRTPMQWSGDRNAGFSRTDPARLYAPPVSDPVYGYQAVNVEAQRRDPSSLFHWLRREIALRKATPALSRGAFELLEPANRKVLAFVRRLGDEAVLVAANLAGSVQPVELDLSAFAGRVPVELSGRATFPPVGSSPYFLSLAPHACVWFRLAHEAEDVAARLVPVPTEAVEVPPTILVPGGWETYLDDGPRRELEAKALSGYLRSQRWFGGKARAVESVRIADWGEFRAGGAVARFALLRVAFAGGASDLYLLPFAVTAGRNAVRMLESQRSWVIAILADKDGREAALHDALADDRICTGLLDAVAEGGEFRTGAGTVRALATAAFARLRGNPKQPLPVVRGPATSSNSLVFYGRRLLLKFFRRLEEGVNPDFEIGRFLTEGGGFERIPQVAGALEYRRADGEPITLANLQALVPNQGDGWEHAVGELRRYFARASGRMHGPDPVPPDHRPLVDIATAEPPPAVLETIGAYLHAAGTLGRRTAELHLALAADETNPAFKPEPLTAADLAVVCEDVEEYANKALAALRDHIGKQTGQVADDARRLLELGSSALDRQTDVHAGLTKTRVHGDYHLGQVLRVENDFVILDFEGEPTRSVEERRQKQSPLKDVAGMLRSYHYAAYAGLFAFAQDRPGDFERLRPWAELWQQWVAAAFLREYRHAAGAAPFVPQDDAGFAALLDTFMLGKAFYELAYELNNRPDWVRIPLGGVLTLLGEVRGEP